LPVQRFGLLRPILVNLPIPGSGIGSFNSCRFAACRMILCRERSSPHGHVLAALGTARRIDLDALFPRRAPRRKHDLACALIIARLLDPAAKLATARMLDPATARQPFAGTRVQRTRNPLCGAAAIGQALGAVFGQRKMAKHFTTTITNGSFSFARNAASIADERVRVLLAAPTTTQGFRSPRRITRRVDRYPSHNPNYMHNLHSELRKVRIREGSEAFRFEA
jgi:hypothetical protein